MKKRKDNNAQETLIFTEDFGKISQ